MTITVLAGILFYFTIGVAWLRYCVKTQPKEFDAFRIAIALGFKILMGCVYGYIFLVKYDGDDTWLLHEYSLEQTDLLLSDPLLFITEMNPITGLDRYDDRATNIYYYVSDLEAWLLAKPFAFVNLLSGGNYYINTVFFSLITFWGHYWLFRLIRQQLDIPFLPLYICLFFVPPVVFWLSGLRADGLIFFFISLSLVQFNKILRSVTTVRIILFFIACLGILILRSGLMVLLVPGLLSWYLVVSLKFRAWKTFLSVYGLLVLVFLGSTWISPGRNFTGFVANRQKAFFELDGNTRFDLDTLKPEASSFVRLFPQAANNTFLRPYPWEAKGILQYAAVLEVMLFLTLICIALVKPAPYWRTSWGNPFLVTIVFFAISLYLLTGYTVPFPGAIVRYKIIGELFFFLALCCSINWKKLTSKSH